MRYDDVIMAVVEQVLGNEVRPHRLGAMIAQPTSGAQSSHRDSAHLFPDQHTPAFKMSFFLPLVDVRLDMGPTDFWPGSHMCGANNGKDSTTYGDDPSITKVQFETDVGDAIAFDYRIVHRGAPNDSDVARPIFYHDFARQWVRPEFTPDDSLGLDGGKSKSKKTGGGFGAGSSAAKSKTKKKKR